MSEGHLSFGDFTVISLHSSGSERWVYTRDWGGSGGDRAYAITYGLDGNIYASGAGGVGVVVSLTPAGSENWTHTGNCGAIGGGSIVYGSDGNLYGVASAQGIWSLTTSGTERWFHGDDSLIPMGDIAFGSDGNIYVPGQVWRPTPRWDFGILSLTPDGVVRWRYSYESIDSLGAFANSLCYGTDGNIYAIGYYQVDYITYEIIVVSLTSAGSERWVYRTGENHYGGYFDIVYGADGKLYAATPTEGSIIHFGVICLSASGIEQWLYKDTTGMAGLAKSITYGDDGNVYASGIINRLYTGNDFSIVSLTSAGSERWIYTHNSYAGSHDDANDIIFGSDGNLYAAGTGYGGTFNHDDFTVLSVNPATGIEEHEDVSKVIDSKASIVNGPLRLPEGKKCRVFDITGRVVAPDIIRPGIYFIEVGGVITRKVVKVR